MLGLTILALNAQAAALRVVVQEPPERALRCGDKGEAREPWLDTSTVEPRDVVETGEVSAKDMLWLAPRPQASVQDCHIGARWLWHGLSHCILVAATSTPVDAPSVCGMRDRKGAEVFD